MGDERHTAELLAFPGCPEPEPATHAVVVEELERQLEMAKRGEIVACATAIVLANGGTQTSYTNADDYMQTMVNASGVLHYRLMKKFVEG
jgi:antirestriction protein ArdC